MTFRRLVTSAALRALRPFGPGRAPPQPDFAPRRIAVMRFGGFGDVLAVTSLTRALREDYPDATIDFYTDPASTVVLGNNPDIDNVVVAPKLRLGRRPATVRRAIAQVRQWTRRPYDLAFIAHHEFDILLLALLFRARYRVGFDINERGFDFAFTHSACTYTGDHPRIAEHFSRHFTVHYQQLLHAFQGRGRAVAEPRIAFADAEIARARAWLAERGVERDLVVIAPGGSTPTKLWPVADFAAVARGLLARGDVSVMVMVGPAEAGHERHFAGLQERFVFDAGGNSFRENMAIASLARAMVGNDTGLMHVAAAFGVPAVAIFGPTPATVFGYAHRGHRVLTADLPCVPCNAPLCRLLPDGGRVETAPCLLAIPPALVLTATEKLLGAPRTE